VLGLAGVVSTFGIFYLAESVYGLDRASIQSLIYLKLSIAGHMTIFVTRTRGPLWSNRPANVLLAAVVGTQIVATLIAVFGVFMAPIGWRLAGLVWLYAAVWALINDRIKLLVYRMRA
jgi:H+-transporting ATPase